MESPNAPIRLSLALGLLLVVAPAFAQNSSDKKNAPAKPTATNNNNIDENHAAGTFSAARSNWVTNLKITWGKLVAMLLL